MRPTAAVLLILTVPVTVTALASSAAAQTVVQVDGVTAGTSGPTGGVTPTPDLATVIGPIDILDLSTGHASVIPFFGTPPTVQTTEQFWTAAGITGTPNAFEHRAVYDNASGHFFVTADEHVAGANRRYLAVSAGSTASGPWRAVAIPAAGVVTATRVAVDANGVYLTGNTAAGTTSVLAIPLPDALAATPSLAHVSALVIPEPGAIPAIDAVGGKATTDPEWFAARGVSATTGNTVLDTYPLQWHLGEPATLGAMQPQDLGALYASPPATATQPGPVLLDTSDATLRSLSSIGTVLYGVAATSLNGQVAAFSFRIDTTAAGGLSGVVATPGADFITPALAVDPVGDVGVIGVETSAAIAPSVVVTAQSGSTPSTYWQPPQLVSAGQVPYACGAGSAATPFGRYSSLTVSPSGTAFYGDAMFGSDSACGFGTSIVEFEIQLLYPADDFPSDPIGAEGPVDPIDQRWGGCACSTSGDPRGALALLLWCGVVVRRRRG